MKPGLLNRIEAALCCLKGLPVVFNIEAGGHVELVIGDQAMHISESVFMDGLTINGSAMMTVQGKIKPGGR
jgi:hypothetical protein